MTSSVASVVSRLSPISVRSTCIPRFIAGPSARSCSWQDWSSQSEQALKDCLLPRLSYPTSNKSDVPRKPKVVIFGEQHHQPRVLAAQLQLIHILATCSEPLKIKVTIVMEHFNLLQQDLLRRFSLDGDAEALQAEYSKSSEGFRLTNAGYLPLLLLANELDNVHKPVIAGFPPREWARIIMRQGKQGIDTDDSVRDSGVLEGFDRWEDILVAPEHAAYISSSISGKKPDIPTEVAQGGLKAAQAFKDAVMAWKIDEEVEKAQERMTREDSQEVIVAVCGSGHCEYDFGVTERIRSCPRGDITLLVTKPDDGEYWQSEGPVENARPLADGVIVYEAVDV